jgi:hypothetical protein
MHRAELAGGALVPMPDHQLRLLPAQDIVFIYIRIGSFAWINFPIRPG